MKFIKIVNRTQKAISFKEMNNFTKINKHQNYLKITFR